MMIKNNNFIILSVIALAAVLAASLYIRLHWIEPLSLAEACLAQAEHADWLCRARGWVVWSFVKNGLGIASLVGVGLAWLIRSRWLALLAAAIATAGLILYCYEYAAVGLVGALLVMLSALQHHGYQQQYGRSYPS